MRFRLLIVFALVICSAARAQRVFTGGTFDYNTGIGDRYTYGIGFHVEANPFRSENFYLNWHYSIGTNSHGEFYGHAGMSLLFYRSEEWWLGVNSFEGLLGAFIVPLIIPNGVTYYLPYGQEMLNGRHVRMGVYCNPVVLEYWNSRPYKVTSWTIETGTKFLIEIGDNRFIYLGGGVSFTNNIRRAARLAGFGNEDLVHVQIGLVGWTP